MNTQSTFDIPAEWPSDGLLDALLATSTPAEDYTTSSSESDFSPCYSSPFSSPAPSPDLTCNIDLSDSVSLSLNNYFPPTLQEESLESIIQNIMSTDASFGFNGDLQGPSLKKRKLSELNEPNNASCVITNITKQITNGKKLFLTREQLLQLSSDEFDVYKQTLQARHSLTPEETDKLKKQRRVIKNREYSQSSRQKKRQRVQELESRIAALETENETLKTENQSLKQKLWKIIGAYQRTRCTSAPASDSLLPAPGHTTKTRDSFFSINSPPITSSMKATGACLFIMLFSFGLMFTLSDNQQQFSNGFPSRTGRIILSSEDISQPWYASIVNHLSRTISALEDTNTQNRSNLRFVTTVTTNIDSSFESQTNTPMESWDDTHICDYESTNYFHLSNNQTVVVQ